MKSTALKLMSILFAPISSTDSSPDKKVEISYANVGTASMAAPGRARRMKSGSIVAHTHVPPWPRGLDVVPHPPEVRGVEQELHPSGEGGSVRGAHDAHLEVVYQQPVEEDVEDVGDQVEDSHEGVQFLGVEELHDDHAHTVRPEPADEAAYELTRVARD